MSLEGLHCISSEQDYVLRLRSDEVTELVIRYSGFYVACSHCPEFYSCNPTKVAKHVTTHLDTNFVIILYCRKCERDVDGLPHFYDEEHRYFINDDRPYSDTLMVEWIKEYARVHDINLPDLSKLQLSSNKDERDKQPEICDEVATRSGHSTHSPPSPPSRHLQ